MILGTTDDDTVRKRDFFIKAKDYWLVFSR